jgi:hypothetical protein
MKKKSKESIPKRKKLMEKIIELKDSILEEFDMMELIEDSIKDVFECNLECSTCSTEEQGHCMQNFKKANLYWIRKIVQDERMIKDIVVQLDEMVIGVSDLYNQIKEQLKQQKDLKEIDEFEENAISSNNTEKELEESYYT